MVRLTWWSGLWLVQGMDYGPHGQGNVRRELQPGGPARGLQQCDSRLSEYTSMAREVHGPEYDPSMENLDAEIVMRVEGDKKHGRYWICDSTINTASTPSLSQIRARSTSSSPAICSRPTTTHAQMEALWLEQERLRQEIERNMLAQREAVEADRQRVQAAQQQIEADRQAIAADQQRVGDMCRWMHSLGEKMGEPIPPMIYTPPPIPAPPPPVSTHGQSWASNDPNLCPNPQDQDLSPPQ